MKIDPEKVMITAIAIIAVLALSSFVMEAIAIWRVE